MKYFFLAYLATALLVVGVFGFRGDKFSQAPIQVFPDMDDQDKIKTQRTSSFFKDGMGSRKPVAGTVPRGFEMDGSGVSFGNSDSYLDTGIMGDVYGTGMPEGLELARNPEALLRRGKERYKISCLPCHGESGNGKGTVAVTGIPATADLHNFKSENYPDGKMFEVITKGKGLMSGYGYNIPVDDRWAIIAYVRALQTAEKPAE